MLKTFRICCWVSALDPWLCDSEKSITSILDLRIAELSHLGMTTAI
jgi:hypothetical protein